LETASELELNEEDMLRFSFSDPATNLEAVFLGDPKDTTLRAQFQIKDIVRDESLGRFQLNAQRNPPENIYVPLASLKTFLKTENEINMILVSNVGDGREGAKSCSLVAGILNQALDDAIIHNDVGLWVVENQDKGYIKLEGEDVFLSFSYFETLYGSTEINSQAVSPYTTYFWNTLSFENNTVPYSTITAFDSQTDLGFGEFIINGTTNAISGELEENELMINNWTAERLKAGVGDTVFMNYSLINEFYDIEYHTASFTIKHIVEITQKAKDKELMPSFPGIEDKITPLDWDPPFPLDFDLISEDDEDYWEMYKGTPKAFISLKTGSNLWQTDIGNITGVRLLPASGVTLTELKDQTETQLDDHVGIMEAKISVKSVKEDALNSQEGIELFSQMFVAFSVACIVAAAVLIILLVALRVESRLREIGMLRALGVRKSDVFTTLLFEGTFISVLGGFLGVLFGLLFGAFLIGGMNSFWSSIVEGAQVGFHFTMDSLLVGFTIGVIISVVTLVLALNYEGQRTVVGAIRKLGVPREKKKGAAVAIVLLVLGIILFLVPFALALDIKGDTGLLTMGIAFPLILLSVSQISQMRKRNIHHIVGIAIILYTIFIMYYYLDTATLMVLFFTSGFLLLFGFLILFYHILKSVESDAGSDFGKVPSFESKRWLSQLAKKNAARSPKRTMLSVFLFSLTLFVLVSLTINLQGAVFDLDRVLEESGGGYEILGESQSPIFANLADEESRENSGIQDNVFDELEISQFKIKGDVGGTCSNLNRAASPRLMGANESFFDSNSFVFVSNSELPGGMKNPWLLLEEDMGSDVVPAIGDYNTVVWILGLELGSITTVLNEEGDEIQLEIVGIIGNSIFPGTFIIWDQNFDSMYPTERGFNMFLFKSQASNLKPQILQLEGALSDYGFDAVSVESQVVELIETENTYISVFQVILVFGLVIGTLGFGIVASRNALERRREIGILRAMGFKQNTVLKALLYENSYVVISGIVIGFASGILASSIYLVKLNVDVLSWPWLYVAGLCLISYVIAIISSLMPTLKSSKMSVSEALRVFE
jgi:ABC-type antimicrobial peptide transport system permease subunit